MGSASAKSAEIKPSETSTTVNGEKPKCKACCACPETKRARDACIVENGEMNCQDLIKAHRDCMRKMGFTI